MSQENGLAKGRVKWFSVEKGYGFVLQDSGGEDVYVNARVVPAGVKLDEDDVVEYAVEKSKQGLRATSIQLIQRAAP
jgi:cold shock protein